MGKQITTMEWRQYQDGSGPTYTFSPHPNLNISTPPQRTNTVEIPFLDGAIVQVLGLTTVKIVLNGYITVYPWNYDNLKDAKDALYSGIGTGVGQLHIISNSGQVNAKHVYYVGLMDGDIRWAEQDQSRYLQYALSILCADPTEYVV